MITLKLKVIHRLLLVGWLNEAGKANGNSLSQLNQMLKIVDKISFTEEENKLFKVHQEERKDAEGKIIVDPQGNPSLQIAWSIKDEEGNDIDVEKDFELSDEQKEQVYGIMKSKDEKKEFTFEGLSVVREIAEKVGYSF